MSDFCELDLMKLEENLVTAVSSVSSKSTEDNAERIAMYDPFREMILSFIETAVEYVDLYVTQTQLLSKMEEVKRNDIIAEINDLKEEIKNKVSDDKIRDEQLSLLEIRLKSL